MATTSTDAGAAVFPPGRYGRRRDPVRQRRRRLVTVAVAILVAAAGVGIAIKLFNQYNQPPYQVSNLITKVDDGSVTFSFTVTVPAGMGASCTIVANAHDGARIATAEIAVPPALEGETTTQVSYTLKTPQRAYAGIVPGCGPPSR